ncbi:fractalkine [Tamandua tetradactyla]|uniref:fractalkine n=1 Tax=Tamandua tetradactyla TaxID=48850 RepID=UPI0040546CAE
MTPGSVSWLLRLAALCHLTSSLTGQQHGVKKCRVFCDKMTSKIPVALLIHYEQNRESCGRRAIILETRKNKFFCADPKEKWVQEAMEHLDRQPAAPAHSGHGGTFEKQVGGGEARSEQGGSLELTSPSQETQTAAGTSPELPTGPSGSPWTRPPLASKAQGRGPPAGPWETEPPSGAAASTATAWQSSAGAGGQATDAPSTEGPTPSQSGPEDQARPEDRPVWVEAQGPMAENSPGPEPTGSLPAHTDAFLDWGPGSMAPAVSEEAPSRETGASGSWTPKSEEPMHATVDPQRLGVLITPVPDSQAATQRQAVGLLAFLGFLFCLGVVMFAYQSLQGCPRKVAGEVVEGLRYVPRSCGSSSYVLVPV